MSHYLALFRQKIIVCGKIYFSLDYRLDRHRFLRAHLYLFLALLFCTWSSCLIAAFCQPVPTDALALNDNQFIVSASLFLQNFANHLFTWCSLFAVLSLLLTGGRLRDLDHSLYWSCLYIFPFINLIFFLYLCLKKGQAAPNCNGFSIDSVSNKLSLHVPTVPLFLKSNQSTYLRSFNCHGSLNRRNYFLYNLLLFCVTFCLCCAVGITLTVICGIGFMMQTVAAVSGLVLGFSSLIAFFLGASLLAFSLIIAQILAFFWQIRRWHDLGQSGIALLWTALPYYILLCVVPHDGTFIMFFTKLLLLLWLCIVYAYLLLSEGKK